MQAGTVNMKLISVGLTTNNMYYSYVRYAYMEKLYMHSGWDPYSSFYKKRPYDNDGMGMGNFKLIKSR